MSATYSQMVWGKVICTSFTTFCKFKIVSKEKKLNMKREIKIEKEKYVWMNIFFFETVLVRGTKPRNHKEKI